MSYRKKELLPKIPMILEEIYTIIEKRKKQRLPNSYTASLFQEGVNRIIQKVGEESVEVIIATKGRNKKRIIAEMADLYFSTLVLLSAKDIHVKRVFEELEKRRKKE